MENRYKSGNDIKFGLLFIIFFLLSNFEKSIFIIFY